MAALAALLLVAMQTVFHPFQSVSLSGYVYEASFIVPTLQNVSDGKFQRVAERVCSQNFGFREIAVRLHNQAMYSLFGETGPFVAEGRGGYLFERTYIPAVCGENYTGSNRLVQVTDSVALLDHMLKQRGKQLLVVIAPNKLRYHSAKLDLDCRPVITNYKEIKRLLVQKNIEVLDFIEVFDGLEPEYPLFSKSGSHWSLYGAAIGAQTLLDRLAKMDLAEGVLEVISLETTTNPRKTDKDLHGLLNIAATPTDTLLAYPVMAFSGQKKPRAVVVGDSYWSMFVHLGLSDELFAEGSKMFYYNQSVMDNDVNNRQPLTADVRSAALRQAEVVIILTNEDALPVMGWGFLSDAMAELGE